MKKNILSSLLAIAAVAPFAAQAADGTINFVGSVTAQTCTINAADKNLTVTLPTVSTSSLNVANNTAGRTAFQIRLTGCTTTGTGILTKTRAYFEPGSTVDTTTNKLKNMTSGGATNVQIGLLNSDGTEIKAGAPKDTQGGTFVTIPSSGNVNLDYAAQYVATGVATAGAVTSSVAYTLEYQ